MAENETTDEEYDPSTYSKDLQTVILQLQARFGRLPSDNEVYRFIWGDLNSRQRIWDNKGLPEAIR